MLERFTKPRKNSTSSRGDLDFDKPTRRKKKVPEVRKYTKDAKGAILEFLVKHNDQLVTQADIARGSGTAKSKIGKLITELENEGTVVKSEVVPRKGTRYFVQGHVSNGKVTPEQQIPTEQNVYLSQLIESLIWEFVKQTRSTDVLQFLNWIEQQKQVQ